MTRSRFFTPAEVAAHNAPDDLWVSFLGKVVDLTSLAKQHAGPGRSKMHIHLIMKSSRQAISC